MVHLILYDCLPAEQTEDWRLMCRMYSRKHKNRYLRYLLFFIYRHWYVSASSWNPSPWKIKGDLSWIVYIMVSDDLAPQVPRVTTASNIVFHQYLVGVCTGKASAIMSARRVLIRLESGPIFTKAPRQLHRWDCCQISERYHHNIQSRSFETSRDLAIGLSIA